MTAGQTGLENVVVREHLQTMDGENTYVGQKTQDLVSASLWVKKQ